MFCISNIIIGEIIKGITLLEEGKQKFELQSWIQKIEYYYNDRILSIDIETIRIWGELTANAQKKGKIVPISDGLIAATARRHGLHVMTRNVSDFVPTALWPPATIPATLGQERFAGREEGSNKIKPSRGIDDKSQLFWEC